VADAALALTRRIDELHLLYPLAGSRMLRDLLRQESTAVGRLHVATLMKRLGLEALYRRPNTSKPAPGYKVYPYLLRRLAVTRPNQVWATDITYVPMARGFVYLVAVVDWFSRRVLAWRVSISLDAAFCIEALVRHGRPAIFNSDQGSQFTSTAFTAVLHREQIAISMDGKGRWRDNVFAGSASGSVTNEEVYLNAYASVSEARTGIGRYLAFYNAVRLHSAWRQHARPDILQPAASRSGMINPAIHSSKAAGLFKQTEPPSLLENTSRARRSAFVRRRGRAFLRP
jgi:putative transposase